MLRIDFLKAFLLGFENVIEIKKKKLEKSFWFFLRNWKQTQCKCIERNPQIKISIVPKNIRKKTKKEILNRKLISLKKN